MIRFKDMYKLSHKKSLKKTSKKGIEKNIALGLEKMGYNLVIFIIATFKMGQDVHKKSEWSSTIIMG